MIKARQFWKMFVELCGGTLSGTGDIRSPNFPMNYTNNASCIWYLQGRRNNITLDFSVFDTENKADYVEVSTSSIAPLQLVYDWFNLVVQFN
jgi:CUB domain